MIASLQATISRVVVGILPGDSQHAGAVRFSIRRNMGRSRVSELRTD